MAAPDESSQTIVNHVLPAREVLVIFRLRSHSTTGPPKGCTVMGILAFLILGLIAGAIAKALLPGRQGGGWVITLVLGVVGAILGGWIGSLIFGGGLGDFFDLRTWLLSILGAVIVLLIYGAVAGRRSRA